MIVLSVAIIFKCAYLTNLSGFRFSRDTWCIDQRITSNILHQGEICNSSALSGCIPPSLSNQYDISLYSVCYTNLQLWLEPLVNLFIQNGYSLDVIWWELVELINEEYAKMSKDHMLINTKIKYCTFCIHINQFSFDRDNGKEGLLLKCKQLFLYPI